MCGSRLLLHIKILGGRAFTEYVTRPALQDEMLTLHGELFGQRFSSKPALATAEPEFIGEAFIELPNGERMHEGTSASGGIIRIIYAIISALAYLKIMYSSCSAGLISLLMSLAGGMQESLRLLSIRQPLRLSVTQQFPLDGKSRILADPFEVEKAIPLLKICHSLGLMAHHKSHCQMVCVLHICLIVM